MDGWMDGLVVGNCRPSSSVNPLLLFGLARAEWNMPRQIADPVTFWRSFPPALSFSLDSPCTLFEPVLTVPLSPDSCLKTSSLGDSGTPSRFQLTRPSQVTTSVFLFCRFADPAPSCKSHLLASTVTPPVSSVPYGDPLRSWNIIITQKSTHPGPFFRVRFAAQCVS
ncbi:hypothetical protein FSOLCH5_012484 [Fusarium solani]